MKNLIKLIILTIVVCMFWQMSNFLDFNRGYYLSNKALDLSKPFNVRIDVEFLKGLKPANE